MGRPARRLTQRVLFCGLAVVIAGCAARTPARQFPDLRQRVKPGTTVYVIDNTGSEVQGELVDVSESALTLAVNGDQRRVEHESVRQVQTYGDSLWNGLLIGVAVGTAAVLMTDPKYEPCSNGLPRQCADYQVGQRILAVGIWGVVGAGIDALVRGRHQVYVAADQSSALSNDQEGQIGIEGTGSQPSRTPDR